MFNKFIYFIAFIYIYTKNKSENYFYIKNKNIIEADILTYFNFDIKNKKNLTFPFEINLNYYPICLNQPKYNSIIDRYIIKIAYYKLNIGIIGGREKLLFLHFKKFLKYSFIYLYLFGCDDNLSNLPSYIKIIDICKKNKKTREIDINKTIEYLINYKIDILFGNEYEMDICNYLKNLNIKTIELYHNHFFFLNYVKNEHNSGNFHKKFKCVSLLVTLIPNNRILWKKSCIKYCTYLPNPTTFNPNKIKVSYLNNKNILMLGRCDSVKRYEIGIDAMKYVIIKEPDAKLYIVGICNNTYSYFLKNYTNKLGLSNNIVFNPLTNNTHEYYKNSSIFLLTSIFEGCPMTLTESKLYGLPTIVVGMNYLSYAKNGVIYINDNNPKLIADEILKIFSNKNYRELEGKKARESLNDFSNEVIYKRWIELFIAVKQGNKIIEKYINKYDIYNEKYDYKENEILYKKIFNKNLKNFKEFNCIIDSSNYYKQMNRKILYKIYFILIK